MTDRRNQIIGKLYEVALRPSTYDDFMDVWHDYLSQQLKDSHQIKGAQSNAAVFANDPELEDHFRRAFELQEILNAKHDDRQPPEIEQPEITLFNDLTVKLNDDATNRWPQISSKIDLQNLIDPDDKDRFDAFLDSVFSTSNNSTLHMFKLNQAAEFSQKNIVLSARTATQNPDQVVFSLTALTTKMHAALTEILKQTYQLTKSELELVEGLVSGQELNEIANTRSRSIHTIRTQLKNIFAKTNLNSQADVIRVVAALANIIPENSRQSSNQASRKNKRNFNFAGKPEMPVEFFGPDGGFPILFLHGMLDGVALPKYINFWLEENHIQLISPIRPGFGDAGSNFDYRYTPKLFSEMLGCLLDELSLERVHIIGHMAGALYAFAASSMMPNRIAGIANVSGGVPIISSNQFSFMAPRQRTVAYTARYAPVLLKSVLQAGIAQLNSKDRRQFLDALYRPNTVDQRSLNKPHIAEAIMGGYQFAVLQGHAGFASDSYHMVRDWSDFVENSAAPVLLLHGKHDPVVDIETVRDLANKHHNRINLIEFPYDGQLTFYESSNHIMTNIVKFFKNSP